MRSRILPLVAVLALAGCGSVQDRRADEGRERFQKVFAAIEGLDGAARERKLVELAKAEGGRLSLYTSLTHRTATAASEAFEAAHRGIDVSLYRATSEKVAERVAQEARAGYRGADAVETGGTEMVALARRGVFLAYRPPGVARLAPGSAHPGWTTTRLTKFVISWNTRLVPAGRQPRSWEDLADPRWRDKLALEESDADWFKSLRDYWIEEQHKPPAQADRLFEGIARNARIVQSHNLMAELLGAGEYSVVAADYLHLARGLRKQGAPVAFMPLVEPVFSRAQGIGLLETARHPAAAVLYVDWLLGEGQELLKRNNVSPSRRDLLDSPSVRDVPVDLEEYVAQGNRWQDRYERTLRLARRARGGG